MLGAYIENSCIGLGWERSLIEAILEECEVKFIINGLILGEMTKPTPACLSLLEAEWKI